MNSVQTAFARELYHILSQSDIPVFVNMKEEGIGAITSIQADSVNKTFTRVMRSFYKCADLEERMKRDPFADAVLDEARNRARAEAPKAKEEFCKYFG